MIGQHPCVQHLPLQARMIPQLLTYFSKYPCSSTRDLNTRYTYEKTNSRHSTSITVYRSKSFVGSGSRKIRPFARAVMVRRFQSDEVQRALGIVAGYPLPDVRSLSRPPFPIFVQTRTHLLYS